ncbi:polysaccharide deacetylase family protein [Campylobacter sp. MIT 21-1682]|nr:polysaccharide deacetylase family protein [Campylobacter sp. MIT 21-1682]MCX2751949.1 polysaccharide deacetylase family protein [Campylobacter sp. MIT 21-1682]
MPQVYKILDKSMLESQEIDKFTGKIYTQQDNDTSTLEFKKLFNYFIKYEFREYLLDELVKVFSSDEEIFNGLYMNEEELCTLVDEGMIVGSHSKSHFVFSKLGEKEQSLEIKDSFDFLEKLLGRLKVKIFCYPYGGFHTFTAFTERFLSEFGVTFSFNVQSKDTSLLDLQNRPQALPRYDCNEFAFGKSN